MYNDGKVTRLFVSRLRFSVERMEDGRRRVPCSLNDVFFFSPGEGFFDWDFLIFLFLIFLHTSLCAVTSGQRRLFQRGSSSVQLLERNGYLTGVCRSSSAKPGRRVGPGRSGTGGPRLNPKTRGLDTCPDLGGRRLFVCPLSVVSSR